MTALELCLHLYEIRAMCGGRIIQRCAVMANAPHAAATFVIGPDAEHLGVGILARPAPEKWASALEALKSKLADKVVYWNDAARVAVVLPAREAKTTGPFFSRWVWNLGHVCFHVAQVPIITSDIAKEKASPVADLERLRSLRQGLSLAKRIASGADYETETRQPFPFGLAA